jgi:hypothetical protein
LHVARCDQRTAEGPVEELVAELVEEPFEKPVEEQSLAY